MSKSLKKGSKAAKAWGEKMRRLRGSGTKRKKSTRKGQRRKTARRAYEGIKRKARKSYKRRKSSSSMKLPRIPSVVKKAAIGLAMPLNCGAIRPTAMPAKDAAPTPIATFLITLGILGIFIPELDSLRL